MSSAINDALNQMQNNTVWNQALDASNRGTSNELNQDMFLKLMLEQLKYQDPMNPMDNQEFLAQQAQFTQLNELQKLNTAIGTNNTVMQSLSLIGKEVTLMDPDDPKKTITGVVEEAVFDANGSAIKVNGKDYPIGLVLGIRNGLPAENPATGGTDETAGGETSAESKLAQSIDSFTGSVSKIFDAVEFITKKISQYIK